MNFVQVDAYKFLFVGFSMSSSLQIPMLLIYASIMLFGILGTSFLASILVFIIGIWVNKVVMRNI